MMAGCALNVGAAPVISEFLAQNTRSGTDDDGNRSDWIEIYNPDNRSVNLAGWALTDDPDDLAKWPFPSVSLRNGQYLVVYASGKDRRALGAPLHTNFRLNVQGDFLALVNASGEIVSSFGMEYPPQQADVSYGTGQRASNETVLLPARAPARALIPSDGLLGRRWTERDFDDSAWRSGRTGVGYDYGGLIGLDVRAMRGTNPSVYVRVPFVVDDPAQVDRLVLRFRYEDGFVAYLNGERIAADNAPATVSWNATASADRPDSQATTAVDIDIADAVQFLQPGENMLAVHGLNRALTSSDILIDPQLISIKEGALQQAGFLMQPSPGEANREATSGLLHPPSIQPVGGTFTSPFSVTIQTDGPLPTGTAIYYTLDGTNPNLDSDRYTAPIRVTRTVQLRTRILSEAGEASPVIVESYLNLASDIANFSSDLPLIVLENFRGGRPPQSGFQDGYMMIIDRGEDGRATLRTEPELSTRVGLKVRGSSTAGRPKPSLSLEAWDDLGDDVGITPLGLPRDSDWVLWGPYNFDRSMMHNPFIYELSNQIGRYAPRTRFVEVFLNTNGGSIGENDYYGVYALTEKIKRDDDRVDVEKLFPEHDRPPTITGGYVLKIDRADPGDSGFSAAGQTLRYVDPKETVIEQPERSAQQDFLRDFFRDFGRAVNGSSFRDPEQGYAKYVDVDAAIDHHLLNVLAFNVDALRLSGYMHLPRGGKLTFGPIWDFDRALGSTDGRDANPATWRAQGGDRGTDFFNYPWWNRMFRDIDFFQKYIDRFQTLRNAEFSQTNTNAIIDGMAAELTEAQVRDVARWGQRPRGQFGGTYQGEVRHMKDWLGRRIRFMESQFVDPPEFEVLDPVVAVADGVTIGSPEDGEIYYTLDGSDPRLSGGFVSQSAVLYEAPIVITESVEIIARVRNLEHRSLTGANNPPLSSKWSGPVRMVYAVDSAPAPGDLQITALHYNPPAPSLDELAFDPTLRASDFEYLELRNSGTRRLDLTGVTLSGGIRYEFSADELNVLFPNQSLVLAANRDAFALRYGTEVRVAGRFRGALDDDLDLVEMHNAEGLLLLAVGYRDDWLPASDGHGFALSVDENVDPTGGVFDPSRFVLGPARGQSGGQNGSIHSRPLPVVIGEVLNNSEPPTVDAVELINLGDNTVDLGGWYLTDEFREPMKYRFPEGAAIPAGATLVVDESQFGVANGAFPGFRLSSGGEEVYLFSANVNGELTGHVDGFAFNALPAGWSQGPWMTSTGETDIVAFDRVTLGEPNSSPHVGALVVTEIFASPSRMAPIEGTPEVEFFELTNRSGAALALGDGDEGALRWRVRGGVQYDFSEGTVPAGARIVVVDFDPGTDAEGLQAFRNRWTLAPDDIVVGPFRGRLDNAGDSVRVERSDPSLGAEAGARFFTVDRVRYSNAAPWPVADSPELSLQRVRVDAYGNDPANWSYDVPNPGGGVGSTPISIEGIQVDVDRVVLMLRVERPGSYVVEWSDDLVGADWMALESLSFTEPVAEVLVVQEVVEPTSQRFYRIVDGDLAGTP